MKRVYVAGTADTKGQELLYVKSLIQAEGVSVSHAQLRHLNPLPRNTGDVLERFRNILIPEINLGQLSMLIRARFLVDAVGLNKVRGKPYRIAEIEQAARDVLAGKRDLS